MRLLERRADPVALHVVRPVAAASDGAVARVVLARRRSAITFLSGSKLIVRILPKARSIDQKIHLRP